MHNSCGFQRFQVCVLIGIALRTYRTVPSYKYAFDFFDIILNFSGK